MFSKAKADMLQKANAADKARVQAAINANRRKEQRVLRIYGRTRYAIADLAMPYLSTSVLLVSPWMKLPFLMLFVLLVMLNSQQLARSFQDRVQNFVDTMDVEATTSLLMGSRHGEKRVNNHW